MDVEITNLKVAEPHATEEVHLSGGLKGVPTKRGWALFPVSDDKDSDAIVFKTPKDHFKFATQECGLRYLGSCMNYISGENSPSMEIWEFGVRDPLNGLDAADSWACVGHQASKAGDTRYAEVASYISSSLRSVGLRLRGVSNGYHDQLNWALANKKTPGNWFSNAALQNLYTDFHSLASELSSARDHIAMVAAMHAGAPGRIDSLARLEDWVEKAANRSHAADPMIHILITALGTKAEPSWLRVMGDIRNEMLHRVPMSANRSVGGLVLEQTQTSLGTISKIRLGEPSSKASLFQQPQDPLIVLAELSSSFELLCRSIWKHAKYPAEPLTFSKGSVT